jgi:hypothetical protein
VLKNEGRKVAQDASIDVATIDRLEEPRYGA